MDQKDKTPMFNQKELNQLLTWLDRHVPSGECWHMRDKIVGLIDAESAQLNPQPGLPAKKAKSL